MTRSSFSSSRPAFPIAVVVIVGAFALGRVTAARSRLPEASASTPAAVEAPAVTWPTPVVAPAAVESSRVQPAAPRDPRAAATDDSAWASIQRLDQTPPCEQREEERLRLIEQWAAKDPKAALEYARGERRGDRRAQAMSLVAATWAKHDPSGAWQWARSLGPEEQHHAHTVLEEIARRDPAMAARMAADFARQDPQQAVAMSLTAMRGMAYDGHFDAARALAGDVRLASVDDRATLYNFAAGQWAHEEPEKAASWVQTLPEGPLRSQALVGLGESWAETDPPRAADFAGRLPPGPERQVALRQAISGWGASDPDEATRWIGEQPPSPDFDQAIAALITQPSVLQEHVDLALQWASAIADPALKLTALDSIVAGWSARDPASALAYVKTSPALAPEARDWLLLQMASRSQ